MSKLSKITDSLINQLSVLTTLGVKWSKKELAREIAYKLTDEINYGNVDEDYLKKYNCMQLTKMLNKHIDKQGEHLSEKREWFELTMNIVLIMQKRTREYRLITGDSSKRLEPKEVDKVLFPTQKPKVVKKTNSITIDKWEDLHIEVKANSSDLVFQKIIDGEPTQHKQIAKTLRDLHLGDKTKEILTFLAW